MGRAAIASCACRVPELGVTGGLWRWLRFGTLTSQIALQGFLLR